MLSIGGGSLETWREVGKKLDVPWKIWKVGGRGVVFGEMLSNWSLRIRFGVEAKWREGNWKWIFPFNCRYFQNTRNSVSKLSYSGFFFCSWSTRLPRWNWLKAGKNLLCGRGWWNLRDARPECEWSDKRPLLNSFFHFKRISKFLLPSQRLRDSCYFNAFLQLAVRHGGKWNYFSCYPRCLYCNQLYEYSFFWVILLPEFGKPELQNPP